METLSMRCVCVCVCTCSLKVLLVPGGVFMINSSEPCPYVRAAFSLSTPEQIDEVYTHMHTHMRAHTHTHLN